MEVKLELSAASRATALALIRMAVINTCKEKHERSTNYRSLQASHSQVAPNEGSETKGELQHSFCTPLNENKVPWDTQVMKGPGT